MGFKKILFGFVSLCCLLILAGYLFLNPILKQAKPEILKLLSDQLNTPVEVRQINVRLFPFPGFTLNDLEIGEKEDKIKIGLMTLTISPSKIFNKVVSVKEGQIRDLSIEAVLENGKLRLKGVDLDKFKEGKSFRPDETIVSSPYSATRSGSTSKSLEVEFEKVVFKNVDIKISNQKTKQDLIGQIKELEFLRQGKKAALNILAEVEGGTVNFNGALPTHKLELNDLRPSGLLKVNLPKLSSVFSFLGTETKDLEISDINLIADVSFPKMEIKEFNGLLNSHPFFIEGVIEDLLQGGASIMLKFPKIQPKSFKAFNDKLLDFEGEINSLGCKIDLFKKNEVKTECVSQLSQFKGVELQLKKLDGTLNLKESKDFKVSVVELALGGGTLVLDARNLSNKPLLVNIRGDSFKLEQILKLAKAKEKKEIPLAGIISQIDSQFEFVDKEKSGSFGMTLSPLTIQGFNVFKKVSDALEAIPNLSLSLSRSLPPVYANVLLAENSEFREVTVSGRVEEDEVSFQKLKALSKGYRLTGEGSVKGEDLKLDLSFIVEPDLVSILELNQPKLKKLKNEDGSVVIPLTIKKSKDGSARVYPDIENLLKQQIGIEIKKDAKKALDKVSPGLGGLVEGFLN